MQARPFGRGNKPPRPRAVEEEGRPAAAVLAKISEFANVRFLECMGLGSRV